MLEIFNTLGKIKSEFKPLKNDQVSFYQCGPTVYSRQHIGNMSSAVRGDLIRRTLMFLGYNVKYVKNITDVGHLVSDEDFGEDKMAKGSKKEGLAPSEIAAKYTQIYHQDIYSLNVLPPSLETIASEYVIKMAEMVQQLLDKQYAYQTSKAIYFDVSKFPNYTQLNGQNLEKNKSGAGHGDVSDKDKRNPFDFAVWFFKAGVHQNALQTWEYKFDGIEQPILQGFPGWHIECSAMAKDTLGEQIDIHMGGVEHIAVHHTNEIAQSEATNGKKYVNYWLHHELLMIDNGKMSKSIGNVYTVEDIVSRGFDPMALRYFFLQAHYRSKQNFTWEALKAASIALKRLQKSVSSWIKLADMNNSSIESSFLDEFTKALEDDFNIPQALAVMWNLVNAELDVDSKLKTILKFDEVLGLNLETLLENPVDEVVIDDQMQKLLIDRKNARQKRDYKRADEIRDIFKKEYGLEIIDLDEGEVDLAKI